MRRCAKKVSNENSAKVSRENSAKSDTSRKFRATRALYMLANPGALAPDAGHYGARHARGVPGAGCAHRLGVVHRGDFFFGKTPDMIMKS